MLYMINSILYRKESTTALNILNELSAVINTLPEWDEKPDEWLIANPSADIVVIRGSEFSYEALEYLELNISKKNQLA
ncbi:MAG: hypothetical protein XXXJIFNMEKO3_02656 [Candidatus Erwinia impunctatus]|nr:hypothetical protein XXXJIFNMEKO_02656 [Culicoides impunctatus]